MSPKIRLANIKLGWWKSFKLNIAVSSEHAEHMHEIAMGKKLRDGFYTIEDITDMLKNRDRQFTSPAHKRWYIAAFISYEEKYGEFKDES